MRAVVFEQAGHPLTITDLPDLAAGTGELVLRVRSCGVCGTDLHLTADPPAIPPGTVLGHEFAGEVVQVGDGVRGWKVGDRACALPFIGCGTCAACFAGDTMGCPELRTIGQGDLPGGFAELVRVGAREALRLPDDLDFNAAALVEPLAVGLHAVRAAGLRAGDSVLVLGAGPIGLATATWAKHVGASDIVVADTQPARLTLAPSFGATMTLDVSDERALAQLDDLAGGPPGVVFECVGRPGMLQQCVQLVRRRGCVVVVGACMAPDNLFPAIACLKEVVVRFVVAYAKDDFGLALRMLAHGRIAGPAMITRTVGMNDLPRAFEALRSPTTACKLLLTP